MGSTHVHGRVGVNLPDLQATSPSSQRFHWEVEGPSNPRGAIHIQRSRANDPSLATDATISSPGSGSSILNPARINIVIIP
jgi:hypothetical protein